MGMPMMKKPSPTKAPMIMRRPSQAPSPEPLRRATYPYLTLVSPDDRAFNPIVGDVCVKLENAEFDAGSITFTINGMNETSVALGKDMACVGSYAFRDGANSIEVFAKDATGVFQLSISRQIQAGSLSLTTNIFDETGSAFTKETTITAKLSDDELVSTVAKTGTKTVGTRSVLSRGRVLPRYESASIDLNLQYQEQLRLPTSRNAQSHLKPWAPAMNLGQQARTPHLRRLSPSPSLASKVLRTSQTRISHKA